MTRLVTTLHWVHFKHFKAWLSLGAGGSLTYHRLRPHFPSLGEVHRVEVSGEPLVQGSRRAALFPTLFIFQLLLEKNCIFQQLLDIAQMRERSLHGGDSSEGKNVTVLVLHHHGLTAGHTPHRRKPHLAVCLTWRPHLETPQWEGEPGQERLVRIQQVRHKHREVIALLTDI